MLYIIRGLPGSGKSYLAERIPNSIVFSTDNYWIRPDGTYDFNPNLLSQAHTWNYKDFVRQLSLYGNEYNYVIDNTNTTYREFERYVRTAIKAGLKWTMVEPNTAWKFSLEHLVLYNTHGVPAETIVRMMRRWESTSDIINRLNENELQNYEASWRSPHIV